MADDSQQDASPPADAGRTRRAPPTIDLEATDVTTAPKVEATETAAEPGDAKPQAEAAPEQPAPERSAAGAAGPSTPPSRSGISPWVVAPFSGAVAAALVIGIGWMLGWPAVQAPPAAPQVSASTVDDLGARVTSLEARAGKPVVDPALAGRADALEKSVTTLRGDVGNLRAQVDKLGAAIDALKSAPRDAAGNVDLTGINDRIAKLEQAITVQSTAIAKADAAAADAKAADAKAADDLPLRRLVAASLLDVAARHGDPFKSTLATAKTLAPDPAALKPLDQFASTGVPSPQMLGRELLNLVPKFSPSSAGATASGGSILDRLEHGAEKLVQIERTDAVGNDRGAVIARATGAALRNDIVEARRELSTLSPEDRAPAQAWLDKVAARDAALSASRQFADSAMAALGNPGQ
ncbi:hypothetical protein [Bradyrhizobium sp. Tv2a-2]|uniref:COG4223 family protein n=1 Tax=Bradyrhizobium sp. Tv2a-2 TaxID=113395 RepID=UPI000417362A|nr:hypothetical protein [Bradyrhizobium sp. Tv2a-2]